MGFDWHPKAIACEARFKKIIENCETIAKSYNEKASTSMEELCAIFDSFVNEFKMVQEDLKEREEQRIKEEKRAQAKASKAAEKAKRKKKAGETKSDETKSDETKSDETKSDETKSDK